jgi:hypothetical protein
MPAENLRQYCSILQQATFWGQRPEDEKAMEKFLSGLAIAGENDEKVRRNSAAAFVSDHGTSMYCEFADHFIRK